MSIEQIFSGFQKYAQTYPKYVEKTRDLYRNRSRLATVLSVVPRLRTPRSATYVFAGNVSYFCDVIALCANHECASLTTGGRTHLKAVFSGRNSYFVTDLYHGLNEYLDADRNVEIKILENIERLSRLLEKISPTFLFIQSDTMPFERELIFAARKSGIVTVCVQHGLFTRETPHDLTEGKFADIFLAYDEEQAKIVKEGSPACRVFVSGSLKRNSQRLPEVQDQSVVFLGQPYPLLYEERKARIYIDLIREISDRCQNAGLKLWYKPHPGEIGSAYLDLFPNRLSGNIESVLEQFQHFLGISSTTLHQSSIRGKTAIQIISPDLHTERFSDLGYCYSYDRQELGVLFANIKSLSPYTSSTLDVFEKGNLESRWAEVKALLNNYADVAISTNLGKS
jgi:hypothetical protein